MEPNQETRWHHLLRLPLRGTEWFVNWFTAAPLILAPIACLLIIAAGRFGRELGLDHLFWHDDRASAFLNGVSLGLLAWQSFLIHFLLLRRRSRFKSFLRDAHGVTQRQAVQVYFMSLVLGYSLLVLLARLPLPLPAWLEPWWLVLEQRSDTWLALGLGLILSFLLGLLLLSRAHQLRLGTKLLNRVKEWEATIRDDRQRLGDPIPPGDEFLHNLASAWFFFATGAMAVVLILHWWPIHGLPPVTVLGVLLALVIAVYGFIAFHLRGLQYLVVGVAIFWLAVVAPRPYQLELPHLEGAYAHARTAARTGAPADLADVVRVDTVLLPGEQGIRRVNHYRLRPKPDWLLDSETILHPLAEGTPKRKLILICASGGGIRAAVWTGLMLERMERELPDFRRDVRLLTGASGGMVALAMYAGGFTDLSLPEVARGGEIYPLGPLSAVLARDSLSYPVQTMILDDLPRWFWPGRWQGDRGQAIEAQWLKNWRGVHGPGFPPPLDRTLADLRVHEAALRQPAVIFSPMLVEEGRRLLISNLDLEGLTEAQGNLIGGPARTAVLARGCLEYSRLFPDQPMPLRTAARLSASFPLVSPTVELPTYPALRVVDAGYYDNFGVGLAAAWLFQHRDWIRRHTAGVLVVQVRAYADDFERYNLRSPQTASAVQKLSGDDAALREAPLSGESQTGEERDFVVLSPVPQKGLKDAVTALVTPLEGVLNSMTAQQRFGHDAALGQLAQLWESAPGEPPFLSTLVLEYRGEASLSWQLSQKEVSDLQRKAAHPVLGARLRGAANWLKDR